MHIEVSVILSLPASFVESRDHLERNPAILFLSSIRWQSAESSCLFLESKEKSFGLFSLHIIYFSSANVSLNMTSNSNLSNMRRMVEQLKLEASVERIKVITNKLLLLGVSLVCWSFSLWDFRHNIIEWQYSGFIQTIRFLWLLQDHNSSKQSFNRLHYLR